MKLNKKLLSEDELAALDSPDVESWFNIGVKYGAIHLFAVHDNTSVGPVFVDSSDDFREVERRCWIAGHIVGSYDLSKPFEEQTGEY